MDSAPFETWEGAEAIFTFADSPGALTIFLILTVVVVIGTVVASVRHENASFKKAEEDSK
ncbi:MAG: hypothetical protein Kilf2KO_36330 [Rhodospirillales bacterium]